MYVNGSGFDEPPTSVTTTLTTPGVLYAGMVAVISVPVTTVTFVAPRPPNVKVAGVTKPVPVMVTFVPPVVGPSSGTMPLTDAMLGAAT
jgi:hypothetical protein